MTNGKTVTLETQSVTITPDGTMTIHRAPNPEPASEPVPVETVDTVPPEVTPDLVTQAAETETVQAATLHPAEEASTLTTALETATSYVNAHRDTRVCRTDAGPPDHHHRPAASAPAREMDRGSDQRDVRPRVPADEIEIGLTPARGASTRKRGRLFFAA